MTQKQQYITVRLKVALAGIDEFKLPLEDDGNLHPSLVPFQSVEGLNELLDSLYGQLLDNVAMNPTDRKSMQVLLSLLADDPDGPDILSALREFRRRQRRNLAKRMDDHDEVNGKKDGPDNRDPDTVKRTLDRKKERLKKGI